MSEETAPNMTLQQARESVPVLLRRLKSGFGEHGKLFNDVFIDVLARFEGGHIDFASCTAILRALFSKSPALLNEFSSILSIFSRECPSSGVEQSNRSKTSSRFGADDWEDSSSDEDNRSAAGDKIDESIEELDDISRKIQSFLRVALRRMTLEKYQVLLASLLESRRFYRSELSAELAQKLLEIRRLLIDNRQPESVKLLGSIFPFTPRSSSSQGDTINSSLGTTSLGNPAVHNRYPSRLAAERYVDGDISSTGLDKKMTSSPNNRKRRTSPFVDYSLFQPGPSSSVGLLSFQQQGMLAPFGYPLQFNWLAGPGSQRPIQAYSSRALGPSIGSSGAFSELFGSNSCLPSQFSSQESNPAVRSFTSQPAQQNTRLPEGVRSCAWTAPLMVGVGCPGLLSQDTSNSIVDSNHVPSPPANPPAPELYSSNVESEVLVSGKPVLSASICSPSEISAFSTLSEDNISTMWRELMIPGLSATCNDVPAASSQFHPLTSHSAYGLNSASASSALLSTVETSTSSSARSYF